MFKFIRIGDMVDPWNRFVTRTFTGIELNRSQSPVGRYQTVSFPAHPRQGLYIYRSSVPDCPITWRTIIGVIIIITIIIIYGRYTFGWRCYIMQCQGCRWSVIHTVLGWKIIDGILRIENSQLQGILWRVTSCGWVRIIHIYFMRRTGRNPCLPGIKEVKLVNMIIRNPRPGEQKVIYIISGHYRLCSSINLWSFKGIRRCFVWIIGRRVGDNNIWKFIYCNA